MNGTLAIAVSLGTKKNHPFSFVFIRWRLNPTRISDTKQFSIEEGIYMMQAILMLMPVEAFPALLVVGALLYMVGLRGIAGTLIGFVLFMALMGPFIDSFLDSLPAWVSLLLMVGVGVSIIGGLLGKGVRDNLVAEAIIKLIALPFKIIGWLIRGWIPRR
jgi:hypothetical protein